VNVDIKTAVTKQIGNGNCNVAMVNGEIISIKVEGISFGGAIEFQKNFEAFEQFLRNCIAVYHSVLLEQSDERRSAEGIDGPAGEEGI
jgi:hypothetical protein